MARILIGDDAMFMRATLKKMLIAAGHDVIGEAENGVRAVELYGQLQPELMLLDITMPEKDGLQALGDIMQQYPQARVIMCSALGQENKVREALMLGAKDYLVKPVTPERLTETIRRVLA